MYSETLTYEADGLTMRSVLYLDPNRAGRRPGVLVFPDAGGLGDHAKSRAARLAELGYVALACDLHGEGRVMDSMEAALAALGEIRHKPARIRARAEGALLALQARAEVATDQIASTGYCFGGTMSLELARSGAPIAGVVSFHGGLATPDPNDARQIKAKLLICTGADDPGINAEQRAAFITEMTDAKIDWQMNIYGGVVHGFTNPDAEKFGRPDYLRYDAKADARSWAEMQAFFREIFNGARGAPAA